MSIRWVPVCIIMLLLSRQFSYSQGFSPVYSESFPEIESEGNKVFQTGNGNTLLFCFTKKDGIDTKVFDRDGKLIAEDNYKSSERENTFYMNETLVAIFEINDTPYLFLQQVVKRVPHLYRLSIDRNTGKVVNEKTIAIMDAKYPVSYYPRIKGGSLREKLFDVIKDPESDCYAIIEYNGAEQTKNDMLKLSHYNGQHELINSATYGDPNEEYTFGAYNDAYVDGDKAVYVSTIIMKDEFFLFDKYTVSQAVLTRFKSDGSKPEHLLYKNTEKQMDMTNVIGAMDKEGRLKMFSFMSYYNPDEKFKLGSNGHQKWNRFDKADVSTSGNLWLVDKAEINIFSIKEAGDHNTFKFKPTNMVANLGGGYSYLFEENTDNHLEDIGIIETDNGNQYSYLIRKGETITTKMPDFYQKKTKRGYMTVFIKKSNDARSYANIGYFSYDYISTPNGNFVIYNDYPRNVYLDEDKKPKWIYKASETNAMCYKLDKGTVVKAYLYGAPASDKQHKTGYISASHYDEKSHRYASLILDDTEGKEMMRMAWVSFAGN